MMSVSKIKNMIAGFLGKWYKYKGMEGRGREAALSPDWRKRHHHTTMHRRAKKSTNSKWGHQSVLARVVYLYYFERKYAIPACLPVLWEKYTRGPFSFILSSSFYFLLFFFLKSKRTHETNRNLWVLSAPNEVNLYNRLYYVSMCALPPRS